VSGSDIAANTLKVYCNFRNSWHARRPTHTAVSPTIVNSSKSPTNGRISQQPFPISGSQKPPSYFKSRSYLSNLTKLLSADAISLQTSRDRIFCCNDSGVWREHRHISGGQDIIFCQVQMASFSRKGTSVSKNIMLEFGHIDERKEGKYWFTTTNFPRMY